MKHIITPIVLSLVLTACGGGGGGSSTTSTSAVVDLSITSKGYTTSYQNEKLYPVNSFTHPSTGLGAFGMGKFSSTSKIGLFTTQLNYNTSTPYSQVKNNPAYLSEFAFWTINADGTTTKTLALTGCVHPRKSLVADFNQDGIDDVFVACHGYDGDTSPDLPGEQSKLVLSDGHGSFVVSNISNSPGYSHSASAADVNNDGYPDIVIADMHRTPCIYFYINQHNGTFIEDDNRIRVDTTAAPNFAIELVDTNNDGVLDIVVGGGESDITSPTRILYGDNTGVFGNTTFTLPSVAGRGVVLDFTVVYPNIYVNRTSDNTSGIGSYNSQTLQKVNLTTNQSSIIWDVTGSSNWIDWWYNNSSKIEPVVTRPTSYGTISVQ